MMAESKWFLMSMVLFWSNTDVNGYQLILNDNGPITSGSIISVNATVTNDEGSCLTGDKLIFKYKDDAFPMHQNEISTSSCTAIFPITFETIGPSRYRYEIDVLKSLLPFINRPIISGRGELTVTDTINGQLQLFQNSTVLNKNSAQITYVSTQIETVHKIEINAPDLNFLKNTNSSIFVYWFVDCIYQGNTTDYTFSSNYTQPDLQHEILGIVVASQKNKTIAPSTLANITTTNSTATPSATNSTVTSTESPKTDTSSIIINSTYTADCKQKNPVDFLLSVVQLENSQKYGYFNRSILVKDPVTNVKTQGKVWIQEGEMLELQWSCNGSGPFRFCVRYQAGPYNVTGNETCTWEKNLLQCQMQFRHYFHEPTNYTLIVIMANDVSKLVIPIGINIYKVQKHPQISVIVVPVTFSSIAVVIVVFGIAYYFQNKSRYMVEVADFDFANNSDMECKTFRERLRDAISQAINRTHDYSEYDGSEEQVGSLATTQNQKYGSMQ